MKIKFQKRPFHLARYISSLFIVSISILMISVVADIGADALTRFPVRGEYFSVYYGNNSEGQIKFIAATADGVDVSDWKRVGKIISSSDEDTRSVFIDKDGREINLVKEGVTTIVIAKEDRDVWITVSPPISVAKEDLRAVVQQTLAFFVSINFGSGKSKVPEH